MPALPCGAWAVDLDNDGDLELLALHGKEDYPQRTGLAVLYENIGEAAGLTLTLVASAGPPHGLGALVTLQRAALTDPTAVQIRQVRSTSSYWNSTVLPLHFGVGADRGPFIADIKWPGGGHQRITLPLAGRAYRITEGSAAVVMLPRE